MSWRRSYFLLILNAQLSIRFHHCMLPKGILGLLFWLHSWNVKNKLQANPCDKARKWETCLMLITHLKHSKHNVLAEVKGNLLDQGI
jgi:hypothetical protein